MLLVVRKLGTVLVIKMLKNDDLVQKLEYLLASEQRPELPRTITGMVRLRSIDTFFAGLGRSGL